jgi:hypothetical protein
MQFTPQQLVGAGRYNPATRIGNWNEDLMLEEARMKEFQLRKRQGSLLATHRQKNDFLQVCVPRSFDTQGTIRFGQYVSIGHLESDGLISTNVFEETPSIGSGEYIVTVASSKDALSRNIFRIMPAAAFKESGDWNTSTLLGGVVKYGEPFVLMCNESLLVDDKSVLLKPPMFLKSGLKTDRSMSPITYNQRIWLSEEVDANALWTVERADLSGPEKLLASGNELKAGDAVSFVHKMTGQLLYADSKNKQPTDFGLEIEISAFCSKTAGKHHNLAAEKLGKRTGDTEGRVALPTNVWTFVLASSTEETKDTRSLPEIATVASVARVIQQCLSASSLYGFRIFLQGLAKLEGKNTGIINRDEAKWYITQYKFPLRNEHIEVLLGALDKVSSFTT